MQIEPLAIHGVYLIRPELKADARGFFARTFDASAFATNGLPGGFDQHSLSHNTAAGTLRGLHYQALPHGETKLVQCLRGAMHDVAADVRPESPTYGAHVAVTLDDAAYAMLLIPPGVAHGFQTLRDDTLVLYRIQGHYAPDAARTVHYQDATLNIAWPLPVTHISENDAHAPPLTHRA